MSNGLDPDQDGHLLVLIWVQTVCKGFQQTTSPVASKELKQDIPNFRETTYYHMKLFMMADSFIQFDHKQIKRQGSYRQDCVKFKNFSRTSKRLSYCFQGLKLKKNTDLHVKILLQKC